MFFSKRQLFIKYLIFGILSSIYLSGCNVPKDLSLEILNACPVALTGGAELENVPDDPASEAARRSCDLTILSKLPFTERFLNLPIESQLKFAEAVRVLVTYPLRMPNELRILKMGLGSGIDPTIPLAIAEIFDPNALSLRPLQSSGPQIAGSLSGDLVARRLYNYFRERVSIIDYQEVIDSSTDVVAQYRPEAPKGRMVIAQTFFEYPSPFAAAVIMHESRHGDGDLHLVCERPSGSLVTAPGTTDDGLSAAFGMEITYLNAMINGSKDFLDVQGRALINQVDQFNAAAHICLLLTNFVVTLPRELESLRGHCNNFWPLDRYF